MGQESKLIAALKQIFIVMILAVCAGAVIQMIIYFTWTSQFNGSVMVIGLVFMLVISFVNTVENILSMEKEKQQIYVETTGTGKIIFCDRRCFLYRRKCC